MYLKALEIQGFKSFPDKTVLNFGADITAIVGPNGSGKSNISDAILWVMGEQNSRQLRGAKMEDVIFGGTEKRNQMGFAQVTLVIDNTGHIFPRDESEVAVTRRYYRSGESEYYINRQSVRLKDVNELFMDTGLGREGYSIIGQGRIDEILSVKSADRREVFEEAAGISRFRHRKEEAERKLERTDENLVRINDKIDELELQLGDLVVDAHQILVGALQLPLGLLLPVTVAGDAGGLLKDLPAVGGFLGENLVDFPLPDDGVALPAKAGVHEQLVDILEPAGPAVDIVFALPGTVIPAGDRHLTLFHGEQMPGVVQHQRNFSEAQPFAPGGSVKNHIFHLAAPEGSGGLLSHNPADGIGNVGFSRAVRPHNGRNVLAKGQHGFFREGFKALDLQCF